MHIEFQHEVCTIHIDVITMGDDITVCLYGGMPHVGTCILAIPRPSLSGNGISSTLSCINRTGHLDDHFAAGIAKELSRERNCAVVCSCGIHIDNANEQQIKSITASQNDIVKLILSHLKGDRS